MYDRKPGRKQGGWPYERTFDQQLVSTRQTAYAVSHEQNVWR